MLRLFAAFAFLLTLAACATAPDIGDEPRRDLGDFQLGHNIVVAPDLQKGPLSREASAEQWIEAVKSNIDTRLGRYDGTRLVHLGVNIGGYVLAKPGIPVVMAPKSALIITVTAWDDRVGKKFHEEPVQLAITETTTGESVLVGSGLSRSADEQLQGLAYNAAKAIEAWLAESSACMTESPTPEEKEACWAQPSAQVAQGDR